MTQNKPQEDWSWGIGEKSESYYDYWAYNDESNHRIHVYWDKGNDHIIELFKDLEYNEYDDPVLGYADKIYRCDSKEEALEKACDVMEENL